MEKRKGVRKVRRSRGKGKQSSIKECQVGKELEKTKIRNAGWSIAENAA